MILRLNPCWPFASHCENPISAITSVIGGFVGSSAANSGAKTINTADQNAAQSAIDTTNAVNPNITAAAKTAGDNAESTAATAGTGAITAATGAGKGAIDAATAAGAGVTTAAGNAASGVAGATKSANDLLDPYAQSGADANKTLDAGIAAGGQFDKVPTLSDLQMDPGYAFRLAQGQASLDRSAAARGGAMSGGNIKAQTDYAQGSASQEYQNAFNRYQTATQNNYANVSGVASRGMAAAGTEGANLINSSTYGGNVNLGASQYSGTANMNAAQYAGNLSTNAAQYAGSANMNASQYAGTAGINAADLTSANTINAGNTASQYRVGGATATAQGKMGAANAWTGALNGVGNAAMYGGVGGNMFGAGGLFGNPAASYTAPGGDMYNSRGLPVYNNNSNLIPSISMPYINPTPPPVGMPPN